MHYEEGSDDGFNQFGDGEEDGDGGGVNDDLVGAAFGAKERTKHGGYSAFEHSLERRANEAKQNDCKVRCEDDKGSCTFTVLAGHGTAETRRGPLSAQLVTKNIQVRAYECATQQHLELKTKKKNFCMI